MSKMGNRFSPEVRERAVRMVGEHREVLGADWWPYGIRRNRAALDTFLRYHFEQGLSTRRWTIEEVFVPYLLDD